MLIEISKALTPIIACICIAIIEVKALGLGMNGNALMVSVAALSGLGGFTLGAWLLKKGK